MIDNVGQHKDSFVHGSGWLPYLGVVAISLWGGLVSYFEKKTKFSWLTLFAHLLSSSFAGMMTYFACESAGISGPLTGVVIGVASHMGTPAMIRLAMKLKIVRNVLEGNK